MSRFDYVKYDEDSQAKQAMFKAHFEHLESLISTLIVSRHTALALTALEESYMWVGKAIRDQQIERNKTYELQESRTNS